MDDLKIPKLIEFIKTETLDKGRVRTTLFFFMLDEETFNDIAARYIRGEISVLESRIGSTIKHPKDKYDKKLAKAEAAKNLKKEKLKIAGITSYAGKTTIGVYKDAIDLEIVKDKHGVRIYVV